MESEIDCSAITIRCIQLWRRRTRRRRRRRERATTFAFGAISVSAFSPDIEADHTRPDRSRAYMPTLANNKRRFFERRRGCAATCGRHDPRRNWNGTSPRGHYAPATIRTTLRTTRSPLAKIARFYNRPCSPRLFRSFRSGLDQAAQRFRGSRFPIDREF